MTFVLVLYASTLRYPIMLHGYQDRAECERSATFVTDTTIMHVCIPEHLLEDRNHG